jgi:hypothetical protein
LIYLIYTVTIIYSLYALTTYYPNPCKTSLHIGYIYVGCFCKVRCFYIWIFARAEMKFYTNICILYSRVIMYIYTLIHAWSWGVFFFFWQGKLRVLYIINPFFYGNIKFFCSSYKSCFYFKLFMYVTSKVVILAVFLSVRWLRYIAQQFSLKLINLVGFLGLNKEDVILNE